MRIRYRDIRISTKNPPKTDIRKQACYDCNNTKNKRVNVQAFSIGEDNKQAKENEQGDDKKKSNTMS